MRRIHWFIVVFLLLNWGGFVYPPPAQAANIVVNDPMDSDTPGDGMCSLREAIDNANGDNDDSGADCVAGSGADEITFSAGGTYSIVNGDIPVNTEVTINGGGNVTLDGGSTSGMFVSSVQGTLTLLDLTIQNASSGSGSVARTQGSATVLIIENTIIRDNIATADGGAINAGGDLIVTNSYFESNEADGDGGAIYYSSSSGVMRITNSAFDGNIAGKDISDTGGSGGAIYHNGDSTPTEGPSTIFAGYFVNNSVQNADSGDGGGAVYHANGLLAVVSSVFTGNSADGDYAGGGAIYNDSTTSFGSISLSDPPLSLPFLGGLFVNHSTFGSFLGTTIPAISIPTTPPTNVVTLLGTGTGNTTTNASGTTDARSGGGAIYNEGYIWINGSSFIGNESHNHGGAFISNVSVLNDGILDGDEVILVNSTFTDNIATNNGGAIFQDRNNDLIELFNLTIANNTATSGGGIYNDGDGQTPNPDFDEVYVTNTILANNTGGNCGGGEIGTGNNTASGNNVDFGGTCTNMVQPDDVTPATTITADPVLDAADPEFSLGSIFTIATSLGNGSSASGTGDNTVCNSFPVSMLDQRGFPRPDGAPSCDIGAYESAQVPPTISINDVMVTETDAGTTTMTFTVTLDSATGGAFTVDFTTSDNTATTADNDYDLASGTLNFAGNAGETQSIIITINGDTVVEPDEDFTVTLSNISNTSIVIADDTGVGTISNNDVATVTIEDIAQLEGDTGTTTFGFVATVDNAVAGGFSVNFTTNDGSATIADNDYDLASGTLNFAGNAGETRPIDVIVNGDTFAELDETFTVSMNTPSVGNVTISDTAIGTIDNDDSATLSITDVSMTEGDTGTQNLTFTVMLDNATASSFTVDYATADASATAGSDYVANNNTLTFAGTAGEMQTFDVVINGDTVVEPNETFTATLSNVSTPAVTIGTGVSTATINDNDGIAELSIDDQSQVEGDTGITPYTFTVTLDRAVQGGFTVDFATSDGTATVADSDYVTNNNTLTFAGTAGEIQTITVDVNGDTIGELDEDFTVLLSNESSPLVILTDGTGVGTIENDDSTVLTVDDVSLIEGNTGTTSFVFNVTLSNATVSPFTVDFATSDDTATVANSDYTDTSGTLNFAGTAGEMQSITVDVNGDLFEELDETFTVSLSNTSDATVVITDTGTGTIENDDFIGVTITESGGTTDIVEGGATDSFTVELQTPPSTGIVTVELDPDIQCDLGAGADTPITAQFNNTTWNIPQTITVTAIDDTTAEGNHTCVISNSISLSDAPEYPTTLTVADVTANVTDNDVTGINVDTAGLTAVPEDDIATSTTISINANTPPTDPVTIPVTPDAQCDIGAGAGTTINVVLPANTITAETITVVAVNDTAVETATHPCAVTTGDPTSSDALYNALMAGDVADFSVDVLDNDIEFTVTNSGATSEGSGTNTPVTFTITPSDAITNVGGTVDFTVTDTTATTTVADFVAVLPSGTLNFAVGSGAETITIDVVGDFIEELDFILEFATSGSSAGTTGTATITGAPSIINVTDDDTVGITLNNVPASVLEDVGTITYDLNLETEPAGDVVIDVASTTLSICTVTTSPITLNATNWNTVTDNISVQILDNAITGANPDCIISYTINAGATTADEYDAVTEPNSTIGVNDDDSPGVVITQSGSSTDVVEGGVTDTISIVLNTQPAASADFSLTLTPDAQCEINGNGASTAVIVTILNTDFATGTIVSVSAIDDTLSEGAHSCAITASAPTSGDSAYDGVTVPILLDGATFDLTTDTIPVNITDDDVPGVTFGALTIAEGGTADTYSVVLNTQPSDTVTIDTITPNAQCTISTIPPLTFTTIDWDTPQTITVTAVDDTVTEGAHSCLIGHTLNSTDTDYTGLFNHTINITDNDENNSGGGVVGDTPDIDSYDPALSKIGVLLPGDLGITGERLQWQVTVINNGNATGTNVIFTDTLRDELQIDNVTTTKGTTSTNGQTVSVNIGELLPGETVSIVIETTVLQSNNTVDNTGCVSSDNAETRCVTSPPVQVVAISELPNTGETPWWSIWILGLLTVAGVISVTIGSRWWYYRQSTRL